MYLQRQAKTRTLFGLAHIDALLLSNHLNILYLTGFRGLAPTEREGWVLVTKQHTYLFTDGRYATEKLKAESEKRKVALKVIGPEKSLLAYLNELIQQEHILTLGFEADNLLFQEYQTLHERLKPAAFVPTDRLLLKQRSVKDDIEVETIKQACALGDACMREAMKMIRPGITEKEIAFKLEMLTRADGNELAFDPIVAVDANSAVAHYNSKAGHGVVRAGSVVPIDFGLQYNDYVSDITRMFFLGKPNDRVARAYQVLLAAQERAIKELKTIPAFKDIDSNCRVYLKEHNLPNYAHSTGHGVGLEIHEEPKVSLHTPDVYTPGYVCTIEPGVYFEGEFGMRIEDTVHLLPGKVEILTMFPKDLQFFFNFH